MAAMLERKASSSLFSETASQRFRRESQEVWEQIKTEEGEEKEQVKPVEIKIKKLSISERLSSSTPLKQTPTAAKPGVRANVGGVKMAQPSKPAAKENELFPKRVKSKFIKTRPASWEKEFDQDEKDTEKSKPKVEKPAIRRLSERTKLTQARKI
eukprot:TRINITY_DN12333_c0_g1_i1.p1 TRINITY_DN12333_c0_g1~~TRINITY_DN12333_c0_g1_i1.p1  ORF type:complete len:155 (+),score=37.66 TRINITY_DN12333_c0_g1_i1:53-517(+)